MATRQIIRMAATVAMPQKKLLQRLMKSGRWNSESEIVRYGIELVRREIEAETYAPIPESALTEAYSKLSNNDRKEEEAMARASALPDPDELS
jgi:Arc/MetJ-type ribon-helix-helix transcriptional regulator